MNHWEYAWLSEAAYAARTGIETTDSGCPRADEILNGAGWTRWKDFPGDGLEADIKRSNLRVEVWEKAQSRTVAVAFGGTVATSGKDWKSNLRWFTPKHDDEYTLIVAKLAPLFIEEFNKRYNGKASETILIATGHSLGGGLAQQFAYALPKNAAVPRVRKVYAFDPSPVTGFFSVDADLRESNAKELSIDRIFERGEILAALRSLQSFVFPPAAKEPSIRTVRYALFYSFPYNPIGAHSMQELACKLYRISVNKPQDASITEESNEAHAPISSRRAGGV